MTNQKRPIYYYDECWQRWFWLLEGWPENEAMAFFRKKKIPVEAYENLTGHGRTFWAEGGPIVVWTLPVKKFGARAAIVAHECIHAAHECLRANGVMADFKNDEVVAYLVTVLIRKMFGDLK